MQLVSLKVKHFSMYEKMQESGLIETILLICTSAIWGQYPVFIFSGLTIGSGCSLMAARWQVFFSFLSFLRAHWFTLEGCNQWQLWDLLFTNMVGNIPFLNHIIRSLNVFELRSTLAIRWRRKWQPTSALFPGKPHEQRNLVGYRPWGCKESDMTERLYLFTYLLSS